MDGNKYSNSHLEDLLNEVQRTFNIALTEDERIDTLIEARKAVMNNPDIGPLDNYIKAIMVNTLKPIIKASITNQER